MLNLSSGAIALTKFCKETGFEQEDILAELNNRGIALLRFGNNYYLTKEMVKSLLARTQRIILLLINQFAQLLLTTALPQSYYLNQTGRRF